jgi:FlaA1/EpsC-like NDP-sugar epimerase
VFTGIRPGEKLFEELDVSERSAYKTGHGRIYVSKIRDLDVKEVAEMLNACRKLVAEGLDTEKAKVAIRSLAESQNTKDV